LDIHEALYTTRAMRRLRPDPIPYEAQARILDAAVRAPNVGEDWRFVLVDDPGIKARLAPLYEQAFVRLLRQFGAEPEALAMDDGPIGRAARSGLHLARHFGEAPLILAAFGHSVDGSGVYPAVWSAMLAARAEGIGSTLTCVLQSFFEAEVFDILGVPGNEGWRLHGVVPMGYPMGRWGVAPRTPVHRVATRNRWDGDLGFSVAAPLWPRTPAGAGR
jgi:nitroreductase